MEEPTRPAWIQRLAHSDPLACYRTWQGQGANREAALLLVDFELRQYWLDDAPTVALTAVFCAEAGGLRLAVTDQDLAVDSASAAAQFDNWVRRHRLLALGPGTPLELLPIRVPKPWGQEIWYSAVERRGVSDVATASGRVPLPWLQAVLPGAHLGTATEPLLLLKILDPSPAPVTGDLYFELHESKQEVYVVTHIDPAAWPDGVGGIRYGFAPDRLAAWGDDRAFRAAYQAAVHAYEAVRRQLDAPGAPAQPSRALLSRERRLREEMDSFTQLHPLRVGDVIAVAPGLPHALQHGVRTIEFQTPVYERRILSFAQRVWTQDHWDIDVVLDHMLLRPPAQKSFACLRREEGLRVERIVDFPDFEVRRVQLAGDARYDPGVLPGYALVIVVEGELSLAGASFRAEQALLLRAGGCNTLAPANPARALVLLLALPRR